MEAPLHDLTIVVMACSLVSWLTLELKQPLILAYIFCGIAAGPHVLGLVSELDFLGTLSSVGIALLLFLAGLVMQPNKLGPIFRRTLWVNLATNGGSILIAWLVAVIAEFPSQETLVIALSMGFSSTLLAVKLLPTTTLHQQRMGQLLLAVLVVEDIAAVFLIMFLQGSFHSGGIASIAMVGIRGVALVGVSMLLEQYLLRPMLYRFSKFEETLYLSALGWCLGVASFSHWLGFSPEIGAFVAGLSMARSQLALYIADRLRHFRDFFLVLFFFVVGARTNPSALADVAIPAFILAGAILVLKPLVVRQAFRWIGEEEKIAHQSGYRVGNVGEFAFIISIIAFNSGKLDQRGVDFIQTTTVLTLIASTFWVVKKFPTPLGTEKGLKRD